MVSKAAVGAFAILALLVVGGLYGAGSYFQEHKATVTVLSHHNDTENGTTYYVIVGKDGTLYQLDDPWWKPLDSAANPDFNLAKIQNGQTYCFTYAGWYLPSAPIYWYYIAYGVSAGTC